MSILSKIREERIAFIRVNGEIPNRVFICRSDFDLLKPFLPKANGSVSVYGMNICLNLRLPDGAVQFKKLTYESRNN